MAKSVSKVDQVTAKKWSDSVEKVEQGNEKSLDCLAKSVSKGDQATANKWSESVEKVE